MTEALIAELEREAEATRRVLERVPEDRLSWAPHEKSMTLGQLALHVAGLPGVIANMVDPPETDPPVVPHPEARSREELLAELDRSVAEAAAKLRSWSDEYFRAEWRMRSDGRTLVAARRDVVVRSALLNHVYHHRGQLTVYLRLLDVPVPAIYGPSADENPFA
ncbi:MAG TPA: DinB family protein [Longimicrobiales bacterium]